MSPAKMRGGLGQGHVQKQGPESGRANRGVRGMLWRLGPGKDASDSGTAGKAPDVAVQVTRM